MADVRWQPPSDPAAGVTARVDPATGTVVEEPADTRLAREAARAAWRSLAARFDPATRASREAARRDKLRQAAAEQEATGSWLTEPEPEAPTSERDELRRQVVARQEAEQARVQEAIARREGGGGADGPAVALAAMYSGHDARMEANKQQLRAARRGMTYRSDDPLYRPTREYIGAHREALAAEYQATQEVAQAKVLQEQRIADELQMQVNEEQKAMAAAKAVERVRQAAADEMVSAQREAQNLLSQAVDEMDSVPDVDPGRFWASRTAGQKFAFAISAMAAGSRGVDPMRHIRAAIAEDMDAQKVTNAQRIQQHQVRISGRAQVYDAAASTTRSALAALGDERAQSLIEETARLQHAQRKVQAMWAQHGVQVLSAEQQQGMAALQQQIADNEYRLAQLAAAHPKPFIMRRAVDRGLVKELEAEQARLGKEREMVLGGVVKGLGEEGQRGMSEADVRERRMALEERKFQFDQRQYLANKLEAISATRDLVDSFLVDYAEGIPGVGPGGLGLTTESHQAGKRLEFIREALGRMQSQGAINSEELKTFERLTTGKTDARTLTNLRELRRLITARESAVERPLEEEASAGYRRQTQGRQFDPLLEDPGGAGGGGFQTARPVE